MVSFELGKEIEKDVFRLVTSVGQSKKSNGNFTGNSKHDHKMRMYGNQKRSLNDL